MWFRVICRSLSSYLFLFAGVLLAPLCVGLYYQFFSSVEEHPQAHCNEAFAFTIILCVILGFACFFIGKKARGALFRREGLILVVLIWFVSGALGALPFYFSKTLQPLDAFFESVSGFTTTGASVMTPKLYNEKTGEEEEIVHVISKEPLVEYRYYGTIKPIIDPDTGEVLKEGVEAVSKSLLFWRSMMQWLGGMGIVVLFIAILPALGVGGKFLFQAEVPGPVKDGITPRIRDTASLLWKLYIALSILQIGFLMLSNKEISLYEATTVMFSTISTGGFSTKNASIGFFANANTVWVVTLFMLLGSINFSLYYQVVKGRIYRLAQPEFITYFVVVVVGSLAMGWWLYGSPNTFLTGSEVVFKGEAFREGSFQFVSMLTSTGFATSNYDLWPYATQMLCLLSMYVGSMAGSTGGGIKIARHLILYRTLRDKIHAIFCPDAVASVRERGSNFYRQVSVTVLCFVLLVLTISLLSTFMFVVDGVDPETAFAVSSSTINNVGASFKMAGPTSSCAFLSPFGKILASALMVLGRLELFAVLVLFTPEFWRVH